jgi:hypothetical protein
MRGGGVLLLCRLVPGPWTPCGPSVEGRISMPVPSLDLDHSRPEPLFDCLITNHIWPIWRRLITIFPGLSVELLSPAVGR